MHKNQKLENKPTRLVKILTALNAALFAFALGIILVSLIDYIDLLESGSDYKTSLITTILGITLIVCSYLVIVAMVAIWIYHFLMRKMAAKSAAPQAQNESPLQGLSKKQEQQVIAALKTIAQPLPNKTKLNRARTTQFLRALTELGYIDANLDGKILMPWVETVTGYIDGEPGHFNDQYRKASILDSNVKKRMEEITQLLNTPA